MVSLRTAGLAVCLGAFAACGGSSTDPTPVAVVPTPAPSPTPTPTPTPVPTPTPTPVTSFYANLRFVHNAVCPPGKHGSNGGVMPVGCGRALHISYHYPDGTDVPMNVSGEAIEWVIEEGTGVIQMVADVNPWRRWVEAKAPGDYRISATIVSRKGRETVRAEVANKVIP